MSDLYYDIIVLIFRQLVKMARSEWYRNISTFVRNGHRDLRLVCKEWHRAAKATGVNLKYLDFGLLIYDNIESSLHVSHHNLLYYATYRKTNIMHIFVVHYEEYLSVIFSRPGNTETEDYKFSTHDDQHNKKIQSKMAELFGADCALSKLNYTRNTTSCSAATIAEAANVASTYLRQTDT
jgi:hypothetical protein